MNTRAAAAAAAHTHFTSAALLRHKSSISSCRFPLLSFPSSYSSSSSSSSIRMSSSSASNPNQIVEHVVLFKVKPSADLSAVNAMVNNLNALSSLDSVLHISTGPVTRCQSNSLTFTHMLHSRYRSKADLTTYAEHPAHVSVVSNYVKPIIDDVIAVDWSAAEFSGSASVPPGYAMRLTVYKLKDSAGEAGKDEVLTFARGIKEKSPAIEQLTVGENFSPGRAKGFSICSMAVFKETKGLGSKLEMPRAVGELVDDVLVLDYTVEAALRTAANL